MRVCLCLCNPHLPFAFSLLLLAPPLPFPSSWLKTTTYLFQQVMSQCSHAYESKRQLNPWLHIYLAIYDMGSRNWSIRWKCALRDACIRTRQRISFFWLKLKSQSWSLFILFLEFSLCFPSSSVCRSPWFNLWKCFPHWRRNDHRSPTHSTNYERNCWTP